MNSRKIIFLIFVVGALGVLIWFIDRADPRGGQLQGVPFENTENTLSATEPKIQPSPTSVAARGEEVKPESHSKDKLSILENKILAELGLRFGADRVSLKISDTLSDLQIVGLLIDGVPLYPFELRVRPHSEGFDILDTIPQVSGMLWSVQRFPPVAQGTDDFLRSTVRGPDLSKLSESQMVAQRWVMNIDENKISPQLHVRVDFKGENRPGEIWIFNWKEGLWVFEKATSARRR